MSAEGCALLVNSVSAIPVLCLGHEWERCLGSEGLGCFCQCLTIVAQSGVCGLL